MSIIGAAEELTVYPQLVFRVFPIVRRGGVLTARAGHPLCRTQEASSGEPVIRFSAWGSVLALGVGAARPIMYLTRTALAERHVRESWRATVAITSITSATGLRIAGCDICGRLGGLRTCMQLHSVRYIDRDDLRAHTIRATR